MLRDTLPVVWEASSADAVPHRRWITARKHGINVNEHDCILQQVAGMYCARNKRAFNEKWVVLREYCIAKGMPNFVDYFEAQYVKRADLWMQAADTECNDWAASTNNLLEVRALAHGCMCARGAQVHVCALCRA
jgi:hypothetical protein